MSEPKDFDEYNERFHANQVIEGYGLDVTMVSPCPFCAAAGWARWKVMDMDRTASKDNLCRVCGRSAKIIIKRERGGVGFEVVQTGGPDQPEWLQPKMRRIG